jgi:2-oxoisovalerate dehydrogenase E2 component (dihydrolipoyl transacylase)
MTPAVRRLLREHGLEPAMIVGTGGGGRITREDVINYVEAQRTGAPVNGQQPAGSAPEAGPAAAPARAAAPAPAAASSPAPPAAPAGPPVTFAAGEDETLVPWTQMRKGVANAMIRSTSTVPHAYTTVEVDMSGVVRARAAAQASFKEREGLGLSFVPFVVKATVEALRKHPTINAHWSEDGLLVKRRIGIGIAIAVDNGLIVPVVHDADGLSIAGLNRAVQDLATRARANKLKIDDLSGGTITVNNTGWFGSVSSQSIVNTPQVAIVNLEAIVKRPVVREIGGEDAIVIRSMMNLGAAFDHRATDGAQIGRFVADVKAWLESVGPDTPLY